MWIDQGALKYGMKAKFLFKKRFLSNFQVAHVYTVELQIPVETSRLEISVQ